MPEDVFCGNVCDVHISCVVSTCIVLHIRRKHLYSVCIRRYKIRTKICMGRPQCMQATYLSYRLCTSSGDEVTLKKLWRHDVSFYCCTTYLFTGVFTNSKEHKHNEQTPQMQI